MHCLFAVFDQTIEILNNKKLQLLYKKNWGSYRVNQDKHWGNRKNKEKRKILPDWHGFGLDR